MLVAVIFLTPYVYKKIVHPLIQRHDRAKQRAKGLSEEDLNPSDPAKFTRASTITGRTSLDFIDDTKDDMVDPVNTGSCYSVSSFQQDDHAFASTSHENKDPQASYSEGVLNLGYDNSFELEIPRERSLRIQRGWRSLSHQQRMSSQDSSSVLSHNSRRAHHKGRSRKRRMHSKHERHSLRRKNRFSESDVPRHLHLLCTNSGEDLSSVHHNSITDSNKNGSCFFYLDSSSDDDKPPHINTEYMASVHQPKDTVLSEDNHMTQPQVEMKNEDQVSLEDQGPCHRNPPLTRSTCLPTDEEPCTSVDIFQSSFEHPVPAEMNPDPQDEKVCNDSHVNINPCVLDSSENVQINSINDSDPLESSCNCNESDQFPGEQMANESDLTTSSPQDSNSPTSEKPAYTKKRLKRSPRLRSPDGVASLPVLGARKVRLHGKDSGVVLTNGILPEGSMLDAQRAKLSTEKQRRESDDSAIVSDLEMDVIPESCIVDLGMIHEEELQVDQV